MVSLVPALHFQLYDFNDYSKITLYGDTISSQALICKILILLSAL